MATRQSITPHPGPRQMRWVGLRGLALIGALVVAVPLTGCGGGEEQALAYHQQVGQLLLRNQTLAEHFVDIAAQLREGRIDASQVARLLQDRVIPLANGLNADAMAVMVEDGQLSALHAQLAEAWKVRAEAYQKMLATFRNGDQAGFEAAWQQCLNAKVQEEQFFTQINGVIAPYGLSLNPYPGG